MFSSVIKWLSNLVKLHVLAVKHDSYSLTPIFKNSLSQALICWYEKNPRLYQIIMCSGDSASFGVPANEQEESDGTAMIDPAFLEKYASDSWEVRLNEPSKIHR